MIFAFQNLDERQIENNLCDLSAFAVNLENNRDLLSAPEGTKVVLEIEGGAGAIEGYLDDKKFRPQPLPWTWKKGQDVVPERIYVEGVGPGQVSLRLVLKDAQDKELADDKAVLTRCYRHLTPRIV